MVKALLIVILLALSSVISAQSEPTLECGRIYAGELVGRQPQRFVLQVDVGTIIDIQVEPLDSGLNPHLMLKDSDGKAVFLQNATIEGQTEVLADYAVPFANPVLELEGEALGSKIPTAYYRYNQSVGAYTIQLNCADAPAYPNLAPTVFDPTTLIVPLVETASGTITSGEIYQYTVQAVAGAAQLDLARVSGNQNLGLVVLSPAGEVLFYGGLIASTSLTTTLQLAEDGEYMIVVFPVHVTPPTTPEATAFQLTLTPG